MRRCQLCKVNRWVLFQTYRNLTAMKATESEFGDLKELHLSRVPDTLWQTQTVLSKQRLSIKKAMFSCYLLVI